MTAASSELSCRCLRPGRHVFPLGPTLLLLGIARILVTPGAEFPYPPLEGEGRTGGPGWGGGLRFWLFTPTRRVAATSPLKGEVVSGVHEGE